MHALQAERDLARGLSGDLRGFTVVQFHDCSRCAICENASIVMTATVAITMLATILRSRRRVIIIKHIIIIMISVWS